MSFGNYRNTRTAPSQSARTPWTFEYFVTGGKSPKLTSRIIEIKRTQLAEVTETAPFGPTTKKTWRTESEAAVEENYD